MSDPNILLRALSADGILRLTLNDVARRNALSEAMLAQLGAAFCRGWRGARGARDRPCGEWPGILRRT